MKFFITKTNNLTNCQKQIIVNDNILENPKNISNAFNEHFVHIGNSLSRNTPDVIDRSFSITSLINTNPMNSFFLQPIAEKEVLNHMYGLKSSKSTGRYGIPVKYIELTGKIIAPILTKIYNCCIADGYFPDILKIAEVIPFYKTGPKNKCTNYRPISILSPLSKIFEKCLHFQLYNYFSKNNLFCKNQYGFKKHVQQMMLSLIYTMKY